MDFAKALSSIGAISGIVYGVSQRKSFWGTAGFAVVFAIGGAAIGMIINNKNEE